MFYTSGPLGQKTPGKNRKTRAAQPCAHANARRREHGEISSRRRGEKDQASRSVRVKPGSPDSGGINRCRKPSISFSQQSRAAHGAARRDWLRPRCRRQDGDARRVPSSHHRAIRCGSCSDRTELPLSVLRFHLQARRHPPQPLLHRLRTVPRLQPARPLLRPARCLLEPQLVQPPDTQPARQRLATSTMPAYVAAPCQMQALPAVC